MNKSQMIRDHVATHPGCTNRDIAQAIGAKTSEVATVTGQHVRKGVMHRAVVGRTITNTDVYGYAMSGVSLGAQTLEHVVQPLDAPTSKPKPVKSGIDAMIDEMAASIAKQVANKVKRRIMAELETLTPKVDTVDIGASAVIQRLQAPQEKTEKPTMPRVGVVGLLPQQAGALSAEFADCIDLVFWHDGPVRQLRSMATGCDVVFVHTRHSGHSTSETLLNHGANIRNVTGGLTNMKEALAKWFIEEVQ